MENKKLITKLKNNAELAQAAYGYYHLITNSTNQSYMMILKDEKGEVKSDDTTEEPVTKEVTLTLIFMDNTYKDYRYTHRHCHHYQT